MELNGEATRTVNITKCLWSRGTENRISNDESCREGEEREEEKRENKVEKKHWRNKWNTDIFARFVIYVI